ncbi:hypothetical protein G5B30_09700 [Sphingobacterium sp. SGG-5]|uniref:hypothetical protein n=1 Tax=Sphingobacterium sp. SGG-5 TaxID=2710881 RepID=UPI0013ECE0B9|nr:hypothetical protein [Sphingobacterium sp. SGG-5]NGM62188.1 hypothetical protein [Sphingobacterium sp. SGG-5]
MKTTLSIAAVVLTLSLSSFASTTKTPSGISITYVMDHYIGYLMQGQGTLDERLFTKNFEMTVYAQDNERKINKRQLVRFLKKTKGLSYDCETNYKILDASPRCTIVKASMAFEHFTRVDYITLCLEKEDWKISKVVSTYP